MGNAVQRIGAAKFEGLGTPNPVFGRGNVAEFITLYFQEII